jgi:propanediol dehydratase small subunit
VEFDPSDYPLGTRRPDLVVTPGGVPLREVTLDAARDGVLDAGEMRATPATLRLQAQVARAAHRTQLAENLERAAELALVPDDLLLEAYTALRPGRATAAELEAWAARLDGFEATRTAAFVREAAAVYAERGLLADG